MSVAVVTGASRGLGRHIASALVGQGWTVEGGSTSVARVEDLADATAWVQDILARHPRVDLLVNAAGIIDDEVDVFDADPQTWARTIEVNLVGAFNLTWLVGRHLREAGGGRIINLNSGAATRPGDVASAYNASKAGLARLTGSTHAAGAEHGVLAFDLMPGVVRTDMTASMPRHRGRTEWTDPASVTDLVLAIADGTLDAWSGRMFRAGVDTPASLAEAASTPLAPGARTLRLAPLRPDDPVAGS